MNPRVNDTVVYACGAALFVLKFAVSIVIGVWAFITGHPVLGSVCAVLSISGFFGMRGMIRRFKAAKEEEAALLKSRS